MSYLILLLLRGTRAPGMLGAGLRSELFRRATREQGHRRDKAARALRGLVSGWSQQPSTSNGSGKGRTQPREKAGCSHEPVWKRVLLHSGQAAPHWQCGRPPLAFSEENTNILLSWVFFQRKPRGIGDDVLE